MNYFVFIPNKEGVAPLGSFGQMIIRDLKTLSGIKKRISQMPQWYNKPYIIQSYINFYDEKSFKTIYIHKP